MPLSEPRLLLFEEEDRRAFFLVGGVLDIGAPIALHGQAVGERPAGGAQRHDRRRQGGNGGDKQQGSRRRRLQELTFFTVPPKLLARAKLVSLHIQIDKLTS